MTLKDRVYRVSEEHFEKFAKLKKRFGVSFKDLDAFGTKEQLQKLFDEDEHLNQIPLKKFDAYAPWYQRWDMGDGTSMSLAEVTCLIKHCLITEVIGARFECK